MQSLSKFILFTICRWKIIGDFPRDIKQYVLIAAPHTSWIDIPLGILIRSITKTDIHFIGKNSLFKFPQGLFFKWLGGFPVDRSKPNNMVSTLVAKFKENEHFVLGLSPEGTRKKVEKWKTGFYYIAKGANIPIVTVSLDFRNKRVEISDPFYTSNNAESDISKLQCFFKGIKGKHAEFS